MAGRETYVIIGASLAGAKAAGALREEGYEGRIILVGEEGHQPYERPKLSKELLLGSRSLESVYVEDPGWYAKHGVDLLLGVRALRIDRAAGIVELVDEGRLRYDRLLLATGARPRRLEVPGAGLPGVRALRTLQESLALRSELEKGDRRVVVAGAGWIGLEVAAAAREYGNEVTVVEPAPTPLHRPLGPELGGVFAALHRDHGVTLLTGEGIAGLEGGSHVEAAVTTGGRELPADVVVAAVGVTPGVELAAEAGLETGNGILVDAGLRTSDPAIFAAGDVANAEHPFYGRRIRVEHWANAIEQGTAAGRAMLGRAVAYDHLPFFFTDQYDLGMEFSGDLSGGYDEIVYRGDVASREFLAFWLAGGRLVAGMNVNVWDVNPDVQALIRAGRPLDRDRLADPGVPLTDLL